MTHDLTDATESAAAERGLAEDTRRRILDLIGNRTLRPGDRVGTERELAARLSVSRSTLRQALAMLAQAGVLRRVPGRAGGTFVAAHAKVDRDLSLIVGLPEYLRRQGYVADTQVLSATMAGADELTAAELALPTDRRRAGASGRWPGRRPGQDPAGRPSPAVAGAGTATCRALPRAPRAAARWQPL